MAKVRKCALKACLCFLLLIQSVHAAEFWVSPNGADSNSGTPEQPLATIATAQRLAREWRRLGKVAKNEPVKIILKSGDYELTEPLFIRPEDSGTVSSPTIFEAAPGENPRISGGRKITGWRLAPNNVPGLPETACGKVWQAGAPVFNGNQLRFRQLWIANHKAVRAREPDGDTMNRLVAWDRRKQEAQIPADAVRGLQNPAEVEMILQQQWAIAILRLASLDLEGETARVTFHSPESRIEFEHPWPQPILSSKGNSAFFLANAIEFLDEPDEWFQAPDGEVYYWPRAPIKTQASNAIAPALETLVEIRGSLDRPVRYVQFKGIRFAHTTWMRPSVSGHVPLQAGMFLLDAYKLSPKGTAYHRGLDNLDWIGRPPAAVTVNGANHLTFERCRFEHLASAALDFERGTHDDVIEGCVFRDIGGNGIQMGAFQTGGIETHIPYNPSDQREICERERIANNFISDCGNEDSGCVGIGVGYAREILIEHNELRDLPYTGISLGWGWTKMTNCMSDNRVIANRIHRVATQLCDTAGIYSLSAQPGTLIASNSVYDIQMSPYVFDPEHWFYLYLDEGASFVTVRDNWCPAERFLKNANGPGNVWTNNGPQVSEKIKNAAGL
ncbi:MAG TPA: right-handed parallel beta-helix repeat-containing protein, partial [Verrucomicrobiae bacterium]|nr:right-handed parallel beta-helix repeat-containing protein [Verrucomicrobiae bacterium]